MWYYARDLFLPMPILFSFVAAAFKARFAFHFISALIAAQRRARLGSAYGQPASKHFSIRESQRAHFPPQYRRRHTSSKSKYGYSNAVS